jgi:hypothetical protein
MGGSATLNLSLQVKGSSKQAHRPRNDEGSNLLGRHAKRWRPFVIIEMDKEMCKRLCHKIRPAV